MTATPPPLSDEQHADLRAREAAATPGPWSWVEDGIQASSGEYVLWPANIPASPSNAAEALGACGKRTEVDAQANLVFLAGARDDVPALLAEVDRLCDELAAAHCALSGIEADAERAERKGYDLDSADILQQARDGRAAAPTATT
jgi:hypothetical protein